MENYLETIGIVFILLYFTWALVALHFIFEGKDELPGPQRFISMGRAVALSSAVAFALVALIFH